MWPNLQGLLGVFAIPLLVLAFGEARGRLAPRIVLVTIAAGLAFQFAIAATLLLVPGTRGFFEAVNGMFAALQKSMQAGMQMVFGYLAGAPTPFEVKRPENSFILALQALPLILLISVLSRLLYYWGVLQAIVKAMAAVLVRTFGIGGPLGTVAAAKVFVGMVEAPLLVRPYLATLGRGALFAAMSVGMATVAGTVMALYGLLLEPTVPGAAGHVLAASLMNVPASLMLARLAVPDGFEGGPSEARISMDVEPRSIMDAIAQGTMDGLRLLAAVVALLVVMTALVALTNSILGALTAPFGFALTLQKILGTLCAPLAWLIGIPWGEALTAGSLLGQKIVLNEFIAYLDLAKTPAGELSARSRLIMTYALCGFGNLGALGIMIGGLTAMVPSRRDDILEMAPKAMIVGALATMLSGAVVGVISRL
jgi:CNT family concentrative nucleoside transporter